MDIFENVKIGEKFLDRDGACTFIKINEDQAVIEVESKLESFPDKHNHSWNTVVRRFNKNK